MLFEHGFTWKSSGQAKVCLHDVTRWNVTARNEHFVYAFVDVNVVSGGIVFKQLPRDPANVNAWKNMYDPYNLHILLQRLMIFFLIVQKNLISQ